MKKSVRFWLSASLWFMSVVFYGLGLYFPLLTTRSQLLGITLSRDNVRLYDSIVLFYTNNEILLAIIIFAFTVLLPVAKYIEMFIHFIKPELINKHAKWLHALDKWSMLDVFIVALLILNFKLNSSIIVMKLMPGTTFLAISIILRMGVMQVEEKQCIVSTK